MKTIWVVTLSNSFSEQKFSQPEIQNFFHVLKNVLWFNLRFSEYLLSDLSKESSEKKANEFNQMFSDETIDIIWALNWGAFSIDVLKYLNYEKIKESHKMFLGFSDNNVVQNAMQQKSQFVSLSCPNMTALCVERFWVLESFLQINKIISNWEKEIDFTKVSNIYFDRTVSEDLVPKKLIQDKKLYFHRSWKAMGIIVGWNLSSLMLLSWTEYFPDLKGKILFIEECEEFSIGVIRRNLKQLSLVPWFEKLAWIVFGRINESCFRDYNINFIDMIDTFFWDYTFPIVLNAAFGHVSPQIPYPIWGKCIIDSDSGVLKCNW